jgi:hypothetical protein
MEDNLEPFDHDNAKGKTILEESDQIRQMKFKFGCLGINCLGWLIIMATIVTLYFILR